RHAHGTTGTIDVDGDNSGANSSTDSAKRNADRTTGTIKVDANTIGANAAIDAAARTRTAIINVSTYGLGAARAGIAALGKAEGGWLNEARPGGAGVPGNIPARAGDNARRRSRPG